MVTIPFSFLPPKVLLRFSDYFMALGAKVNKAFPYLQLELDRANLKIEARRYLAMCLLASSFLFLFIGIMFTIFLAKIDKGVLGFVLALLFVLLVLFMQLNYPKIVAARRIRKLEQELLASLRAIMIHLNSGVPLFDTMVIISHQQFGEVSTEFKKTVQKINAGVPVIQALESMALQNPSLYFRRTIWQLINGMKAGANVTVVLESTIENLSKEQIIQIEKYGSQLNPLAMFYMIVAIIMPALGMVLLLVMASFMGLSEIMLKTLFWGLLGVVAFFQVMFSGIIKSKRPSLLGE